MAIFIIFFLGEQRIESRTYDTQIANLREEVERLEEQKRRLILQISQESLRISSLKVDSEGKPISLNDINTIILKKKVTFKEKSPSSPPSDIERILELCKSWFSTLLPNLAINN